jgi:predicted nucleic acid-binding protein
MTPAVSTRPLAIIDTNVALDLLVFGDTSCQVLAPALAQGGVLWIATMAMRDELAAVLARGFGGRWPVDREACMGAWDRWATIVEEPTAGCGMLPCSDPDDQKFIDLAMHQGACWLLSRDRALLRLARRARARDVVVRAPGDWMRQALAVHVLAL